MFVKDATLRANSVRMSHNSVNTVGAPSAGSKLCENAGGALFLLGSGQGGTVGNRNSRALASSLQGVHIVNNTACGTQAVAGGVLVDGLSVFIKNSSISNNFVEP